jgi:hypothetical protein
LIADLTETADLHRQLDNERCDQLIKTWLPVALEGASNHDRSLAAAKFIIEVLKHRARINGLMVGPQVDQWVVGASRSPALLDSEYRQRIYRLQGWVSPVLLVNGHMAGVWNSAFPR